MQELQVVAMGPVRGEAPVEVRGPALLAARRTSSSAVAAAERGRYRQLGLARQAEALGELGEQRGAGLHGLPAVAP